MNIRKINLVLGHEYLTRVKKKSFIFTTIFVPLLFVALMIVPSIIMMHDFDDKVAKLAIKDNSGIVAEALEDNAVIDYDFPEDDIETLKSRLYDLDYDAIVFISALDSNNNAVADVYSKKQINAKVSESLTSNLEKIIEDYKIGQLNIENFEELMSSVETKVNLKNIVISESGDEKRPMLIINMVISLIMGMVIYMFVAMFGSMVMTSVIMEKSNKIMEVIVSSVKPLELMMGKIIGVACVALTQFIIWIILTGGILLGFQMFAGQKLIADTQMTEQISAMGGITQDAVQSFAKTDMMTEVFSALKDINFGYIIVCFIIFFILGYLLYASLYAAVGSAVDNEADTQQLVLPITIPLIIGLLIMLQAFKNPDSALSVWASIIPFTSPMVMLARIPFEGSVPLWQLLLSIGLLIVTFIAAAFVSGKIFRVGILMTGKKYSWKDIWKWLKY